MIDWLIDWLIDLFIYHSGLFILNFFISLFIHFFYINLPTSILFI